MVLKWRVWSKIFLFLLVALPVFASTLSLNYESPVVSATKDSLRSSLWASYYDHSFNEQWGLNAGAKLGLFPTFSPDSFRYKAEVKYQPFYFIKASMRFTHETLLTTTATINHGLYWLTLSPLPFETVQFFAEAGWYQRLTLLTKATILPSFRSSYSEHDFALGLGFKFRISENIKAHVKAATFEELEVYNLNNPFGEVGGSVQTGFNNWEIFSYVRYQILLGFGRLDTFSVAMGARTTL